VFKPDRAARDEVLDDLDRVRARRDATRVAAALEGLRAAARGTSSLMEPILASAENYATIGEVAGVLEETFGSYHPPEGL
jgi:methylmalonyl-CoA mutase N-terminal domain/subunit